MNLKQSPITPYLIPRLQDILFIGVFFFVGTQGFRLLNGDGDLGRHITIGNYILDNWRIPTRDIFSYTMAGEPLVLHEWLLGVVFALATRALGLDGAVLISGIVIAAAFTIVYKQTINRGSIHLAAFLIAAWAGLASFLHWQARPHIFTFLFIAVWIYILEQAINGKGINIWTLPTIMVIWANAHGGFFLGFIVLGAYIAGWAWEYWLGQTNKQIGVFLTSTGLLSFAVSFVNPAGWHLWTTSTGLISQKFIIDNTSEYLSPNFHTSSTWPFLIMLITSILLLGFSSNKLRKHEIFLLAGWTILSLYMARNISLYAIVTAPYLGYLLQPTLEKSGMIQRINDAATNVENNLHLKGIFYPILAVVIVSFLFRADIRLDAAQMGNKHNPAKFPVEATNWLTENPQDGNMYNEFIWGGYLLYRLWPEQAIFIDGTTDFFGEAFTREYARVASVDKGWQDILTKYDVSWAIIPAGNPLVQALQNELAWHVVYQDNTTTIIRKP